MKIKLEDVPQKNKEIIAAVVESRPRKYQGIFVSLFKSPQLTYGQAHEITWWLVHKLRQAYNLVYWDETDFVEEFHQKADMLLEQRFKSEYPHHYMSTEQNKQILNAVGALHADVLMTYTPETRREWLSYFKD